jgi:ribosomal protein L36
MAVKKSDRKASQVFKCEISQVIRRKGVLYKKVEIKF